MNKKDREDPKEVRRLLRRREGELSLMRRQWLTQGTMQWVSLARQKKKQRDIRG